MKIWFIILSYLFIIPTIILAIRSFGLIWPSSTYVTILFCIILLVEPIIFFCIKPKPLVSFPKYEKYIREINSLSIFIFLFIIMFSFNAGYDMGSDNYEIIAETDKRQLANDIQDILTDYTTTMRFQDGVIYRIALHKPNTDNVDRARLLIADADFFDENITIPIKRRFKNLDGFICECIRLFKRIAPVYDVSIVVPNSDNVNRDFRSCEAPKLIINLKVFNNYDEKHITKVIKNLLISNGIPKQNITVNFQVIED